MAELAKTQQGRITDAQLRFLEIDAGQARYWTRTGYLHPCLPGVHAVGSLAQTTEAELFAAVLYAGPNAMLSHATAAHWYGIADHKPDSIHVSTPRRCRSLPDVVVHARRQLTRAFHNQIPVTTLPQTLLDFAAHHAKNQKKIRRALSILDYRKQLDLAALTAICGRGHQGSVPLHAAITQYDPLFAGANSDAEIDWVLICKRTGTPLPDATNAWVHGVECDNVYYDAKLDVEIDGPGNHGSRAQMIRDRERDFMMRSHGWLVLRYGTPQLRRSADDAAAEVRAQVRERRAKLRR